MAGSNTGVRILNYRGKVRAQVWDPRKPTSNGTLGAYRTKSSFATKGAAKDWVAEQLAEISTGVKAEPRNGRHTLGDEIDSFLERSEATAKAPRTHVVRKSHLARVPASLRVVPLKDLVVSDVELWQGQLLKPTSTRAAYHPRTVRQTVSALAMVLDVALRDRRIGHNPARLTSKIVLPRREEQAAMPAEVIAAMRDELPERYRLVVDLAYGAGLRFGECAGMKLTDVIGVGRDFSLRVDRQWTPYAEGREPGRHGATTRYGMAGPKHGSKRVVPINESLVHAINAHVAAYGTSTEGTLLSLEHSGKPLTHQQWHEVWTAAAERAGVSARWSAHDLRHAFGSLHYNAGTPATTVAAWMGHTVQTFETIYAHRDERHDRPVVDPLAGMAEGKVARELHEIRRKRA